MLCFFLLKHIISLMCMMCLCVGGCLVSFKIVDLDKNGVVHKNEVLQIYLELASVLQKLGFSVDDYGHPAQVVNNVCCCELSSSKNENSEENGRQCNECTRMCCRFLSLKKIDEWRLRVLELQLIVQKRRSRSVSLQNVTTCSIFLTSLPRVCTFFVLFTSF